MVGGLDTWGNANACAMRSVTICRARTRSVPGSKVMRIEERPGADLEAMVFSQGTPLSKSCSIGTVINCSTSSAERPRASVWTSTYGGVNSGKTSTGMAGSWMMPATSSPAASATTKSRDFRLAPTILRIRDLPVSSCSNQVLGIGDWGLGIRTLNSQSLIPNRCTESALALSSTRRWTMDDALLSSIVHRLSSDCVYNPEEDSYYFVS